MSIPSDEVRRAHWQKLLDDIAIQEDIAERLRDGRMKTRTQVLGEPEKDTTESDARDCGNVVSSLRQVIELYYSDLEAGSGRQP